MSFLNRLWSVYSVLSLCLVSVCVSCGMPDDVEYDASALPSPSQFEEIRRASPQNCSKNRYGEIECRETAVSPEQDISKAPPQDKSENLRRF